MNGLGEPGRVDAYLGWLVILAQAIEPDKGVEVDHAAALEFRDLDKRHPAPPTELGRAQPGLVSEGAADGDGEPAPQFRGVPVERDVGGVVVAVRADRLPQPRVIFGMNGGAPARPPVRAQSGCPAGRSAVGTAGASGVDGSEAGCGEGGEHQGVRSDGFGNAFASAGGARVEQLPHIAGVFVGAGGAHRCPPVPAPDQQHPIRLTVGRINRSPTSGGAVLDAPAEPDRVRAVPAPSHLLSPPVKVRSTGPDNDLFHRARGEAGGGGQRSPQCMSRTGVSVEVLLAQVRRLARVTAWRSSGSRSANKVGQ